MNQQQKDIMSMTLDELAAFRIEQLIERQAQQHRELEVKGFLDKQAQPKGYDLKKRQTFMIENELVERMDKLAEEHGRGFKVWLANEALREKLDRIEKEETK